MTETEGQPLSGVRSPGNRSVRNTGSGAQQSSRVTYRKLTEPVLIGVVYGFGYFDGHDEAVKKTNRIKVALDAKHIPYSADSRGTSVRMYFHVSEIDKERVDKLGLEEFFDN